MTSPTELRTSRLLLRQWAPDDREPFARLNADLRVMEYFPSTLSRAESDLAASRIESHIAARGWGLWALEVPGASRFVGFTGLAVPRFEAHFTPCVEIGWRLAFDAWGHGYATEAALASLAFGFDVLGLDEVVSFTAVDNVRSRRVMERIGLLHDPQGGDASVRLSFPDGTDAAYRRRPQSVS